MSLQVKDLSNIRDRSPQLFYKKRTVSNRDRWRGKHAPPCIVHIVTSCGQDMRDGSGTKGDTYHITACNRALSSWGGDTYAKHCLPDPDDATREPKTFYDTRFTLCPTCAKRHPGGHAAALAAYWEWRAEQDRKAEQREADRERALEQRSECYDQHEAAFTKALTEAGFTVVERDPNQPEAFRVELGDATFAVRVVEMRDAPPDPWK